MELRHLRYFIATAEELNFTRAAVRLHIAQPALSVQIRKLETEIDAKLFSRENQHVSLTEAGHVFLAQARSILTQASRGVVLAQRAAKGEAGHLAVGYNTSAELSVFREVIPRFTRQWPDVHLTFHNLRGPQQLEKLRRNELDVGFAWLPLPTQEFDVRTLFTERLVALVPAKHRLAGRSTVAIKDLSHEPLALFSRGLDPESLHHIEQLFQDAGAGMNVVYELDTIVSVINFVAMGCGCSILPASAAGIRINGAVCKSLQPTTATKTLAVLMKKEGSDLARTLFRFTVDQMIGSPERLAKSKYVSWASHGAG